MYNKSHVTCQYIMRKEFNIVLKDFNWNEHSFSISVVTGELLVTLPQIVQHSTEFMQLSQEQNSTTNLFFIIDIMPVGFLCLENLIYDTFDRVLS